MGKNSKRRKGEPCIRTIGVNAVKVGDTVVFNNGQRRKVCTTTGKGRGMRWIVSPGGIISLEMMYHTSEPRRLPGVYHPRTGEYFSSFGAAEKAGHPIIRPELWIRMSTPKQKFVRFSWDDKIKVVRYRRNP